VWALVLVATALPGFEPTEEEEEWWTTVDGPIQQAIEAGDPERAQELTLEIWAPLGAADEGGARIRQIAFDNLHVLTMDESAEERLDPPPAHRLEEYDVPTLILVAEHDPPYLQRAADILAKGIMGAHKVLVEGADHVINLRQPERFEELVVPFLADAAP
jgi:pimeloyl-ACP methyl ester carboxylesterase